MTTLGFDSILNRLDSAIVVPEDRTGEIKPYIGEILGFKFWATRLIGSKHFHLPTCLLPRIEGRIHEIYTGYQISLVAKFHPLTSIFLLISAGGLLAYIINSVLDLLVAGVKEFQYLQDLGIFVLVSLLLILYFHLAARRGMKFFQILFAQRLLGNSQIYLNTPPRSSRQITEQMSVFSTRIKRNLPQLKPSATPPSALLSSQLPHQEDHPPG